MKIATPQRRLLALAIALPLAVTLAYGFLPMCKGFMDFAFPHFAPRDLVGFPLLALLFFFSLPRRGPVLGLEHWKSSVLSFLPPILIAMAYGYFRHANPSAVKLYPWLWLGISIPIGEEFLFRGWLFDIVERIFPKEYFTATNPISISLWMSSMGFSLWHLQNLKQDPTLIVFFQMGFTFCLGLWLGHLRETSKGLTLPILGHAIVNIATNLI